MIDPDSDPIEEILARSRCAERCELRLDHLRSGDLAFAEASGLHGAKGGRSTSGDEGRLLSCGSFDLCWVVRAL
jgi:hypothetical protein